MSAFLNKWHRESLLFLFALVIIAPVLNAGRPLHLSTPDIKYAKARVLQLNLSDLYADPVTGYDTFHPPYYYLVLAAVTGVGLSLDTSLILLTVLQVFLLIFLSYAVLWAAYGRQAGFLTCLLTLFIVQFMGSQNILLANSFYFSVPFYLAGLWFYLKIDNRACAPVLAGILWGSAFLISPVYVFLLGLTFLYELIFKKRFRRFLLLAGTFLISIIPFYIQAAVIIAKHFWGTSAFAFWRGWPDIGWLIGLASAFVSPVVHAFTSLPTIMHILILLTAVVVIVWTSRVYWFVLVSLLAYFLTYYHFSEQYAVRIQLFFSLFLVAAAIAILLQAGKWRLLLCMPFAAVVIYSVLFYYEVTEANYEWEKNIYKTRQTMAYGLWTDGVEYLDRDRFVFCTKDTYFDFLAPIVPVHALGAYKTMEYFQLNTRLSEELDKDYQTAVNSKDSATIMAIADKYGIQQAVASAADIELPLFQTLMTFWPPIYSDKYFLILRRPV